MAPAGARSWSGPEAEVIAAITAAIDPADVHTFRYANGAYVVLTSLRINGAAPNSYCYVPLAERLPPRDEPRWIEFDHGAQEPFCAVYRDRITVWEGDARSWR